MNDVPNTIGNTSAKGAKTVGAGDGEPTSDYPIKHWIACGILWASGRKGSMETKLDDSHFTLVYDLDYEINSN